jgi:hypothetical protein
MNIKFLSSSERYQETYQGIEDIRENLNFFQKYLDENPACCLTDDFKGFVEDTKAGALAALFINKPSGIVIFR